MDLPSITPAMWAVLPAVVIVCSGFVLTFAVKLYGVRRRMRNFQSQGLSMPPHDPLLGNLLVMKDCVSSLPHDVHPQYFPHQLRRAIPELGGLFYIDMYPSLIPILVVATPSAAYQIAQEHPLPKFPNFRTFLRPIAGEFNLLSMDGQMWKTWRRIFNPGFSSAHLTSLLPAVIREAEVFCSILQHHAEKKAIFPLKKDTDGLTMDIIGRLALDMPLNSQTSAHRMVTALRRQIPWLTFGTELNLWNRWHPVRPFIHWYNSRIVDSFVTQVVESRFEAHSKRSTAPKKEGVGHSKSMIDLALDTYLMENPDTSKTDLDGHDTTSTSMCYIFHNLSQHPLALQRVRDEHNQVFGVDPAESADRMIANPSLLSQIPFTTAVIKETLRLVPTSSSTRAGEPGFSVSDTNGQQYPTEGCLVWSVHQALHRDASYWPDPDSFIPERWMVSPGDPLYPVKGAWRPFEFGPRNCIGQDLAIMEMKVVMVMALRRFDVISVYAEWDEKHPRNGPRTVHGERAYLAIDGGPSAGLPCRVTRVSQ